MSTAIRLHLHRADLVVSLAWRRVRLALEFAAQRLRVLRYWRSHEGKTRRSEQRDVHAVVARAHDLWKPALRRQIERGLERPAWWWGADLPPEGRS